MKKNLLDQLDAITSEIEDIGAIIESSDTLMQFQKQLQKRHRESNIILDINHYDNLLQVDAVGTITKADQLTQIRFAKPLEEQL